MLSRVVKSVLAFKGMTIKELAEEIGENYNSVYDVVHEKWGNKRGEVASRILNKLCEFLNIDLKTVPEFTTNNLLDTAFSRKIRRKKKEGRTDE